MAVTIFTNLTYCGEQFFYYSSYIIQKKLLITRDTLFTAETSSCGQFIFYFDFVFANLDLGYEYDRVAVKFEFYIEITTKNSSIRNRTESFFA
jgi:hypothetical protein